MTNKNSIDSNKTDEDLIEKDLGYLLWREKGLSYTYYRLYEKPMVSDSIDKSGEFKKVYNWILNKNKRS